MLLIGYVYHSLIFLLTILTELSSSFPLNFMFLKHDEVMAQFKVLGFPLGIFVKRKSIENIIMYY